MRVSHHKQDVFLMVQKKKKQINKQLENNCNMLLSERHDSNFLPEEPLGIFAFPTSPILGMFSFVPPSCLSPSYFFLIFLIPGLSGAVCVPPTSYFCVYHPRICLHSLQRQLCFVWRGKGKQECRPTKHTHTHTGDPDGSHNFQTEQSDVTHKTFKNILLHETEMAEK